MKRTECQSLRSSSKFRLWKGHELLSSCHPKQLYVSKRLCRLAQLWTTQADRQMCLPQPSHLWWWSLIFPLACFSLSFDCVWFFPTVWFLKESAVDYVLSSSWSLKALGPAATNLGSVHFTFPSIPQTHRRSCMQAHTQPNTHRHRGAAAYMLIQSMHIFF